ncbi:hypothetical protein ON010_g13792 [Phytophthora cinnamomi]|nr:hypothetical protein ON010_g13792 [Phytophthora cinnamomi]
MSAPTAKTMANKKYSNQATTFELAALVLLTPLPCLFTVIIADVAPLNAPKDGANSNIVFWCRASFIVWFYTLSFVVQFSEMLPVLPMTRQRCFGITVFVGVGCMLYTYSLSQLIGFPVPFMMVMGAPVWMALLLGSLTVSWGRHIRGNSALQTQVLDGLKMFVVQMSMIVVYPFYIYIFSSLASVGQAFFSLVLLLIKMAIKNGISYYIRSNTDMQPEIIVFNVDVFNALFVSFSMQNSTSKLTIIVIMTVDFVRMASSIREVLRLVQELTTVENQIHLLKNREQTTFQATKKRENGLHRACSIVARRSYASKNVEIRRQASQKSPRTPLKCFFRADKIFPQQSPLIPANPHTSVLKVQETRVLEAPRSESKRVKRSPRPLTTESQNNLVFMERLYARKMLNLLYLVEFTILIEYIEVIVPVVYYDEVFAYAPVGVRASNAMENGAVEAGAVGGLRCAVLADAFCKVTQNARQTAPGRSMVVLHHNELDRTLWGPASTAGRSRATDVAIYIQLALVASLGITCALDYDKPEAVRLAAAGVALLMYFRSTALCHSPLRRHSAPDQPTCKSRGDAATAGCQVAASLHLDLEHGKVYLNIDPPV